MSRPQVATIVRVVVAVAVIAGTIGVIRWLFVCSPPRDQVDMISLYRSDSLFAVVPQDGELVDEYAHTFYCDSGFSPRNGGAGSPTSPGFAEVKKLYVTPADITDEQLQQQFDRPAAAAGWRINPSEQYEGRYCKQTGKRASYATMSATKYESSGEPLVPAVEVLLSASSEFMECFSRP